MNHAPLTRLSRDGVLLIRRKRRFLSQPGERVTPLHFLLWAAICAECAYILFEFIMP